MSHMPAWLWRRAVMVHLWLGFISCSKCFTTVSLRRGVPLVAEGLEGCGAPGEVASLRILHLCSLQLALSDS